MRDTQDRQAEQPQRTWQISQVQQLIGLPRRDIQRACYTGRGGAGILSPQDSSWGRRSYDIEDLAKLFVVRCYRDRDYTLNEVRHEFDIIDSSGGPSGWINLLDAEIDHLRETCAQAADLLIRGMVLRWAVDNLIDEKRPSAKRESRTDSHNAQIDIDKVLAALISKGMAERQLAAQDAEDVLSPDSLVMGFATSANAVSAELMDLADVTGASAQKRASPESAQAVESGGDGSRAGSNVNLAAILDVPGMDLVVEVLLGAGSYERICTCIEDSQQLQDQKGM